MNGLIHLADSQMQEMMNLRNEIDELKRKNDDLMRKNDELYDSKAYLTESKEYYKSKYLADSSKPRRRGPDRRERTKKWRESRNMAPCIRCGTTQVGSGDNENLFDKMSRYETMLHEKDKQYESLCDRMSSYEVDMTHNKRQIEYLKMQNRAMEKGNRDIDECMDRNVNNLTFVINSQNEKIDDLQQECKDLYTKGCQLRNELDIVKSMVKKPCLDENLSNSASVLPQCEDLGQDLENEFPNLCHKKSSDWPPKAPYNFATHYKLEMQTENQFERNDEQTRFIQETAVVHEIQPFLETVPTNYIDKNKIDELENSNKLRKSEINRLQNILFDVGGKDAKQKIEELLLRLNAQTELNMEDTKIWAEKESKYEKIIGTQLADIDKLQNKLKFMKLDFL